MSFWRAHQVSTFALESCCSLPELLPPGMQKSTWGVLSRGILGLYQHIHHGLQLTPLLSSGSREALRADGALCPTSALHGS